MFWWQVIFGAQLNEYHLKASVIRYCGLEHTASSEFSLPLPKWAQFPSK
jgi:hypothetical protein